MSRLLVDEETIRALADILTDTGLTEIEIAEKDSRIRVAKAPAPVQAYAPPPAQAAAPAMTQSAGTPAPPAAPADLSRHPGAVKSPMVGIAYLAPEPGATPFVAEGQAVTPGQTLLLIEAMKTFNQIKAPKGGTLIRLLVTSGAPVEFDEVLAIID